MQTAVLCKQVVYGSREYWQAVSLREAILRKPLGMRFTAEELAGEVDSCHIVALLGAQVVGCVVIKPLSVCQVRLRQLCVVEKFRNQGIGKLLVRQAEKLAWQLGYARAVLHAREPAVDFYAKLGYHPGGETFLELGIPHLLMWKDLTERNDGAG
ncbi:MAG: GNAT family N-acetyltransferase [Kiritimatiellia bacterium]